MIVGLGPFAFPNSRWLGLTRGDSTIHTHDNDLEDHPLPVKNNAVTFLSNNIDLLANSSIIRLQNNHEKDWSRCINMYNNSVIYKKDILIQKYYS